MILWLCAALAAPVDLNTATVEQLDELPGLGLSKAEAIVQHRTSHGPFTSFDGLAEVSGIGPGIVAILSQRTVLGEAVEPNNNGAPALGPDEARIPHVPSATSVDPNSSTAEELATLPGISSSRAKAIVEDRETHGPFESCQQLTRVEGIGQATVAQLRDLCATGSQSSGAQR